MHEEALVPKLEVLGWEEEGSKARAPDGSGCGREQADLALMELATISTALTLTAILALMALAMFSYSARALCCGYTGISM